MTRHKGSKNKPGYKKPGKKTGSLMLEGKTVNPQLLDTFKEELLSLMEVGECHTVSQAAERMGIPARFVWRMAFKDQDFGVLIRQAQIVLRQIKADKLEQEIADSGNIIGKIFLLKGYRPEFRDNYKLIPINDDTKKLLDELLAAGKEQDEQENKQNEQKDVVEGEIVGITDA